jgi:hypothetical protein
MHAPRSELRWEPGLVEVDSIVLHRDAFGEQELPLWLSLRECSVGTDDAMPGEVVVGGEDASHEARGERVDVAEGADVARRDRADPLDDVPGA